MKKKRRLIIADIENQIHSSDVKSFHKILK